MGIFVLAVLARAKEEGFFGETVSEFMAWANAAQRSGQREAYTMMMRQAQQLENDLWMWGHDKANFEIFELL